MKNMMKKFGLVGMLFFVCLVSNAGNSVKQTQFFPGKVWNDTQGRPINAHGGGILFYNGVYYWYGEIKKGKTWLVPNQNWECYRVNAGGVSCYSSKDLVNWQFEGVALVPNLTDSKNDLHTSKVLERPKVIYNKKTKKFVMWLHVDSQDYGYARAGVAVSDKPIGPFQYIESFRPNGQMSRDMTLFQDEDGKAYQIFTSENNATTRISLLTDDYLKPSGKEIRIMIGKSREAPAMFKYKKKYYLITSATSGWSPNKAWVTTADSIMGTWKILENYNPCKGEKADSTFLGQSTHVLPIAGKRGKFIFMADIWNKTDLENSKYVWLPLEIKKDSVVIEWKDSWSLKN
jgi:beta-xylosidase